ncbi:STE20-related kinase adapter protein alpha [Armadillidium nasatum]|uniref:STE20-related kinase adapter protein alpha n=1 Tax=Armadillidium nasatum TaxID=96803 RepID=A0A5N5SX57_9CRUS|nr:STE20-related kinase adapter protein alpha [Armadillidium nasatum]
MLCYSENRENCDTVQCSGYKMAPLEISEEAFDKCCQIEPICEDRGTVWIGRHKPSNSRYVLKIYDLEKCGEELDRIKDEITTVRQLQHRNVIKYLVSFISGNHLWIVMPLIGYTSASRLIVSHFTNGLPEPALALIFKDILCGLHYLHSKGIIHRSIKGTHILVDSEGRSLLCGFRHSTNSILQGKWEKRIHSYPPEAAYNLNWASPEMLKQDMEGYSEKTDIYSLGVTLCELGNGEIPYCKYEPQLILVEKVYGRQPFLYDMHTCRFLFENGKDSGVGGSYGDCLGSLPKAAEKAFSASAHNFVSKCVEYDASARPSAEKLFDHPFIRQTRKMDIKLPEMLHPVTPITDETQLGETEVVNDVHYDSQQSPDVMWDL